jgi:hypothetical protein
MSPAALSIYIFGVYLIFVGISFLFIPNVVLPVFRFEKTKEPWIRVIGLIVIVLAYYYISAAQAELVPFFEASVFGRLIIMGGLTGLVVSRKAQPNLLIFGLIDLAAAIWTYLSLSS